MQNGITRLYNAIWYTQVGRALEQKDIEKTEKEYIDNTHDTLVVDFDKNREDTQTRKHGKSLWSKSEVLPDSKVNSKTSGIVTQKILIDNLDAVRQTYEDIINDKRNNIQRYKLAIGQLIPLIEQKKNSLKSILDDMDKLEKLKKAAIAKSKNISLELKESGLSDREIERHPDYTRCLSSYNDFDSTVKEKNVRVDELEQDIERAQADIEHHKSNITHLHRDVEKIKTEQSEAIADLITAREKGKINEVLSDIKVE